MKKFALPLLLNALFMLFAVRGFVHALATHESWRIATSSAGLAIAVGLAVALGLAIRKNTGADKAA